MTFNSCFSDPKADNGLKRVKTRSLIKWLLKEKVEGGVQVSVAGAERRASDEELVG